MNATPAVQEHLRHQLFSGWSGCSKHDCVVTGPKNGAGTNGTCTCILNANRNQLLMLQLRLSALLSTAQEQG